MTVRASRTPACLIVIGLGVALTLAGVTGAAAAEPSVGLGTSTSFAVLGGSAVTNTGPSIISGDLGVSPGTAITGFPPGTVTGGTIHAADAVADQAQADVTTAYNDAAGRATTANVAADLAGQTLVAGVYTGATIGLTGALTLDAQGVADAVFIFQASSTLITSTASTVTLINGASPCNVFWQVGSSATLGTNSVFVGTILALTSVTANTGATVQGRLLARTAAVTMDSNTVSRPSCATVPVTSTTTAASSTTVASSSTTAGTAPTSVPGSSTNAPGSSTSVPASSTSVPASSTTLPASSTTLPSSSTTGPSTSIAQVATTLPTVSTTSAPVTTTTLATQVRAASSTSTLAPATSLLRVTDTTAVRVTASASSSATTTTELARTGIPHLTGATAAGLLVFLLGCLLLIAARRADA